MRAHGFELEGKDWVIRSLSQIPMKVIRIQPLPEVWFSVRTRVEDHGRDGLDHAFSFDYTPTNWDAFQIFVTNQVSVIADHDRRHHITSRA